MFISAGDLTLIGFLAFLEGILSLDNALVLAMMAGRLPPEQQRKALTYGLLGAVFFRLLALGLMVYLIHLRWVKWLGGGYLLYVAVKGLLSHKESEHHATEKAKPQFWKVVLQIELMDIAFAVDSILAAVALTNKLWIVFTGGMLGVIMMRFAATTFIKLLRKFPSLEQTAFLMVGIIGIKVVIDAFHIPGLEFDSPKHAPFWIFWGLMVSCLAYGFLKRDKAAASTQKPD